MVGPAVVGREVEFFTAESVEDRMKRGIVYHRLHGMHGMKWEMERVEERGGAFPDLCVRCNRWLRSFFCRMGRDEEEDFFKRRWMRWTQVGRC